VNIPIGKTVVIEGVMKCIRHSIKQRLEGGETLATCPKCGGEMEAKPKDNHNVTVKSGHGVFEKAGMYVCSNCGYIEFYSK
jgi:uncharacterized protein with PIN domain